MRSKAQTRPQHTRTVMRIVGVAMLAFPLTAQAQAGVANADTVTAIANAFFDAVVAGRWSEASRLLDTTSLNVIRSRSAGYAKSWRSAPPMTLERFMAMNPGVPRAVAVYQVKESNERTREMGKVLRPYGVEDPDSLLALPIGTYAARWLEIRDERWQLRESARRCGQRAPTEVPIGPYRAIASVPGDSVAYVLYDAGPGRSPEASAQEPRVPRVMVLRRRASAWSILPRDDLVGWGEMVNACG